MLISDVINHCRNRSYMSGVDRDNLRVKATGEVFTPTPLVQELLDKLDPKLFQDPTKTFIDPSCGDGQFLSEVLIRKLENVAVEGVVTEQQFEQALSTIYGIELMPDNVELCRERLLCGQTQLKNVVIRNIVQHDSLKYDEDFNGTNLTRKEYLLSGETVG